MKKILIGFGALVLLAVGGFAAVPATVEIEVAALEDQTGPVSGWLQSNKDPRMDVSDIPMILKLRASGFTGEIAAPEELVVRGTVRKAGLRIGMLEAHGREIELEGRWLGLEVNAR